jgi:putative transposase
MRIVDPLTGHAYLKKRRRRYDELFQPRESTFSCYRRFAFLSRDRSRQWFCDALANGRERFGFQIWAYVIMPEHVHGIVYAGETPDRMADFLQAVKEPVGRKGIAYLRQYAPAWLDRIRVREGRRVRHRFWQPGGGYDRNITTTAALRFMIEYLHANPVRRGLVARAADWEWSSARWFAGERRVRLVMDEQVLRDLQWDAGLRV